jgi:hypothetical protein
VEEACLKKGIGRGGSLLLHTLPSERNWLLLCTAQMKRATARSKDGKGGSWSAPGGVKIWEEGHQILYISAVCTAAQVTRGERSMDAETFIQ